MRKFLIVLYLLLSTAALAQDTAQIVIAGRANAKEQEAKPYVILISADGFRYDLAEKYHAAHLLQLSDKGVRAEYMQPSYPSLTFPNHYTIITGLYPAHHGLIGNTMYDKQKNAVYSIGNREEVNDSSWYGGVPLWVLAERQKMLTACFYWVGSETAIDGVRPTYYYNYSDKLGIDTRINEVKKWLQLPEEKRPHFIAFYFPEVDHAEHKYGPDSKETEKAVGFIDESVEKMTEALAPLNLDLNYIFLSDHGMTAVDTASTLPLPACVDTSKFKVTGEGAIVRLYAKNPADIKTAYKNIRHEAKDYDVYLAGKMPKRWHHSRKDDYYNRIGDIILVPRLPKIFNINKRPAQPGQHGFDPALPEMRATFYAWGPDFKQNMEIPGFENVNIYPLIAKMLGLNYDNPIDGKLKVLRDILK